MKLLGVLVLVLGVLFLLRDLNVWDFWNIQWWTVVFLMVGAGKLCTSHCPMCKKAAKKK